MATALQSLLYAKSRFTRSYAQEAARLYGGGRVESGGDYWRVRLRRPQPGWRYRLKTIKPGVKALVAARGPRPNPYGITSFAEEKHGKRLKGYAYHVLGPYDSPTRLPGTGSFIFPDLQTAKRYASREFLDPSVHQVAIKTMQGQDVLRLYRRRKVPR